jgi:hypothetical protein
MSLSHSPNIVRDGLILCLDAANRKSYPGNGTTWYDISGNNNDATLVNSPVYNSSGYFELIRSSTQYAYTTDNLISKIGLGNVSYTIEIIFNLNSAPTGVGTNAFSLAGHASANGIGTQVKNGITVNFGYRSTSNFDDTNILSLSTWYHAIFTREVGVSNRIYINGKLGATNSISNLTVLDPSTSEFQIGNAQERVGAMDGYISYVNVYNLFFTDVMAKQNFNALRGRYGL